MLVDVLSCNFNDTLFYAPVDAHILLQLELLEPEAHHATVALVHLEQIFSEKATL